MLETSQSIPDTAIPWVKWVLRKKEVLTYARQWLHRIRKVHNSITERDLLSWEHLELRLVGWEYLLRVDDGSPERYLREKAGNKRGSFALAKRTLMHAQSLIGSNDAPGFSFINLHVEDFSHRLLDLLESKQIYNGIAYEIVEDWGLNRQAVEVITEMVRRWHKRIVIDDFPLYPTPKNHSIHNLEILERNNIQPFAVKLEGKSLRDILDSSLDYRKVEQTIANIRGRFWDDVEIVAEWAIPKDMQILFQIDPEILLQWRDLDLVFGKAN